MTNRCIFTIDVEDWFHILDVPNAPRIEQWESCTPRVEQNFHSLLKLLDRAQVRATCFFLGWIAEQYPHLVREALAAGHEIAAHGYNHRLVYRMTPDEFREDVTAAKRILEDITGRSAAGYRAPGFSITKGTPWVFDILAETGYTYDSSVFPASRGHGGWKHARLEVHHVSSGDRGIVEFPITVSRFFGRRMNFFGGGYLRLFPYPLIRNMAKRVLDGGRPVITYVHPREIDPSHPRLPMNPMRSFKSYVNLSSTEAKLRRLLNDFEWITFAEYLAGQPGLAGAK